MFTVSVLSGRPYLLIVFSGPAGPDEFCASASLISELVGRTDCRRLLIDMLALSIHLDAEGDRQVLMHLGAVMPALERLAIVLPARSSRGLLAGAAGQRGIDVAEFTQLPDAESWISRG